jgi:hypothetical protein
MCLTAPELWPAAAREWYAVQDKDFWQQRLGMAGYREFPAGVRRQEWAIDVDAGPVIAGYGVSASAFGVGAARKNGRFDRAYPLAAEMLVTAWELPNGILAAPRLLSNLSDAPLVGEAAILWLLSTQPEKGFPVKTGGALPPYVYAVLIVALLFGTWRILESIMTFRGADRGPEPEVRVPGLQIAVWMCLLLGAGVAFWTGHGLVGLGALFLAVLLPIVKKKKTPKGAEDWPEEATTAPGVDNTAGGNPPLPS